MAHIAHIANHTGIFTTKIFHPNVSPRDGEICVSTLKRDWNESVTLGHMLLVIKSLLINPNETSALNSDAGMLLNQSYSYFEARAKMYTQLYARPADHAPNQTAGHAPSQITAKKLTSSSPTKNDQRRTLRRL